MTEILTRVAPGDLITAELINELIETVERLEQRRPKSGSAPLITKVHAKGTRSQGRCLAMAMGKEATIYGQYLDDVIHVRVDSHEASFEHNDDGTLTVHVPAYQGDRPPGPYAVLALTNRTATSSRLVQLEDAYQQRDA